MGTQEGTKRSDTDKITSIRLSREDHALLKRLAQNNERSISAQVRWMLRDLRDAD